MATRINLEGQRQTSGQLTAIKYLRTDIKGQALWKCVCDCGETTIVSSYSFRNNKTRSCGCLGRALRKAKSKKYLAFGEEKSLKDWATDPRCRVEYATLRMRVNKGENLEEAMTRPSRSKPTTVWAAPKSKKKGMSLKELLLCQH
jgi:hypothetical protein